jgi:hypothetical protein
LTRIDICHAASAGVSPFDNILGASFQALELVLALQVGERARLSRAILGEAMQAAMGGGRTARRTARLLALGDKIRPRVDDPQLSGILALARGMAAHMQGQWRSAAVSFAAAEQLFRDRCTDVRWGINLAQVFGLYDHLHSGQLAELSRRLPPAILEAKGRGDLYALAYMFCLAKPCVQMGADQAHEARCDLDAFRTDWTHQRFSIPRLNLMYSHVQLDLYLRDVPAATRHCDELWRGLLRSFHLRLQLIRVFMIDQRARVALAAAAIARNARPHLQAAQRDAGLLERERMPWADALARLVRAGVAALRRDGTLAVRMLRDAVDRLEEVEMRLDAAAARRRLGELLGGAEGRDLVARANAWMTAQNVVNPSRMTAVCAPGFPGM